MPTYEIIPGTHAQEMMEESLWLIDVGAGMSLWSYIRSH